MAKEPIQILKEQIGNLMVEVAVLGSNNEKQAEEIQALKAEVEELKKPVRIPDKIPTKLAEVK